MSIASKVRSFFTRSYEGATSSYRYPQSAETPNVLSAMHAARTPLARRARYIVANNALASSAVDAWVAALVSYGIKGQSAALDIGLRDTLNASFAKFGDVIDADGVSDIYGLQALMVRQMVVEGESFALMIYTEEGLRLRIIDNEQVDTTITRPTADGGRIVQGVEFDSRGKRVAYWILPENPGLAYGAYSFTPRRVLSGDVIHLFRTLTPGQVRGCSWLAPVILRLHDLDTWADAQLTRQKMAAMLTVFVTSETGGTLPFDASLNNKGISPGAVRFTDPGQDLKFLSPASIGDEVIEFAKIQERHIAVGMGIPLAVLNGDLSQANYGSLRAGLTEWRKRTEAIQHTIIAFQMLRPLWERWAMIEVLSGAVNCTIDDALPVNWIPPAVAWIDPLKDAEAITTAMAAGLKSPQEAIAERGLDMATVYNEIATARTLAKSLGLDFASPPPAANQNKPPAVAAAA